MASKRQTQRLQAQRTTRAERRAEERAQPRVRSHKTTSRKPNVALIGGIVTVLVVAAIVAIGIWRNSAASSPSALTVAADLNPAPNQLAVGTKAPNFTLHDASGKSYSLAAQRGHPVFLEFFAVWCPVCQGEAPTIAKINK